MSEEEQKAIHRLATSVYSDEVSMADIGIVVAALKRTQQDERRIDLLSNPKFTLLYSIGASGMAIIQEPFTGVGLLRDSIDRAGEIFRKRHL